MDPAWVGALIEKLRHEPAGNPPHAILRYEYRGGPVYYLPAQCCDQFSTLYDAGGEPICAPDGGITGKGDGQCPDFFQERSDEVLIWSDSRRR